MIPAAIVTLARLMLQPRDVLDVAELATHSPKRSGAQLYKALQQAPARSMKKGAWTDAVSFIRNRGL